MFADNLNFYTPVGRRMYTEPVLAMYEKGVTRISHKGLRAMNLELGDRVAVAEHPEGMLFIAKCDDGYKLSRNGGFSIGRFARKAGIDLPAHFRLKKTSYKYDQFSIWKLIRTPKSDLERKHSRSALS